MTIVEQGGGPAPQVPDLIKDTTTQSFVKDVIEESKRQPVLIDFWAEWCGPCKMVEPTIEQLSQERAGKMKFGKLNVDESSDIAQKFGVMSIPTFIVFKDGKKLGSFVGALPKESFIKHIDEIMGQAGSAPAPEAEAPEAK